MISKTVTVPCPTKAPEFPRFNDYACAGDTVEVEHDGFRVVATIHDDFESPQPWEIYEGHSPVSQWTQRAARPGERLLCTDRNSHRYYDFAEAVKLAHENGRRAPGDEAEPQSDAVAERAAEHEYKMLKAGFEHKWFYCGVGLQVFKDDVPLTDPYGNTVWGLECNLPDYGNGYLSIVANELLEEALNDARSTLARMKGAA